MLVRMLGSVPMVVVQVGGIVGLVVVSFLDILHLVLNTMGEGVIALSWRGGKIHGLPFVVFVLL
jgi:hypothetical protein